MLYIIRYSEIVNYNFATTESNDGKSTADFTQLVWKNTKDFGLGIAVMQARGLGKYYGYVETFIVAMYSPSGNEYIKGERKETYLANVLPRKRPCNGLACKYKLHAILFFSFLIFWIIISSKLFLFIGKEWTVFNLFKYLLQLMLYMLHILVDGDLLDSALLI